ncbi:MAG: GNAT family N-acetyltransferase [Alcanivoracaceae bacterium]|nr:GNAT family N-acetyltransferase [Alcanivoracaceae bacterium]
MIRQTTKDDRAGIYKLYKKVATIAGGLARLENEVDNTYIDGFLDKTISRGLSLVAVDANDNIVGEIHAYASGLFCFAHVWTELTIAMDPDSQGQGVGRQLFTGFLNEVSSNYPHILRIELIARESNQKAIKFYQSLGFAIEGTFKNRIKNIDETYESDIAMAWLRSE